MTREELEDFGLEEEADRSAEIAEVAYAYWQSRGCIDGHDVEDWLMAEQEVARRHSLDEMERRPAGKVEPPKHARTAA